MKKNILFICLILLSIYSPSTIYGQDWVSQMKDPSVNFYDVQKSFNKYNEKKERDLEKFNRQIFKKTGKVPSEEETEVPGYSQYKRWEWFMAPRVFPTGERFNPSIAYDEYQKYNNQYKTAGAGNWTIIGPTNSIPTGGGGAGRINFVRIDPTNSNTIYVGSPGGGLWKSTTGGTSWTTNTDKISQVIGCTDLAIDPTNTNIMYLATGDGDAGDTYSVGLLKSIDGGATWNKSGLNFYVATNVQMSKVLINPNNTNTILVATSKGIYRSTDGGVTFSQSVAGSFKDMEFKPGDPNTVYISGSEFYRSTNGGQSFTKITAVLPAVALISRMAIAVTLDDPNYIYLIAAKPTTAYSLEGLYRSTNSGVNFTKLTVASPANILGRAFDGNDPTVGQGWYDLGIDVSPTDKNEITVGGINVWQSIDGGSNFNIVGYWIPNSGAPYVHADVHSIDYANSNTIYAGCDGGIFKSINNGGSWSDLSNGLQISQMYGFGHSTTNPNLIINGWQDNGTNLYDGTSWDKVIGGDGMLAFIDRTNDQNMWGELPNGGLQRSTNGGLSFSSAVGSITETGAWVTPWIQDPVNASTLYAGFNNLYRSTNGGISWTKLTTFATTTGTLSTIGVSPANNQVIWTAKPGFLYLSTNGGTTFTSITNVPTGNITSIACSNTDANKAWITYSGYTNKNKVFQTNDQGATWINLSGSIPNIPVNTIVSVDNSNDALYIGTDIGVFYKDATLSVWQPFFAGLPNVVVTQLSIYYAGSKIRASTYGRGMWQSDLYVAGSYPPTAAFGSDKKIACPGTAIQFSDYSSGQPTSWSWSFPGGNPATSTLQNPIVSYNIPGTYPVSLTSTNINGTDATTYNDFVIISASPVSGPSTIGDVRCGPGQVNMSATGSGLGTLRWWDAAGGGNLLATGSNYSTNINLTTAFYVDEELPSGISDITGESLKGVGGFFTASDIRGIYFDVLNPVVLNSFEVYANSAGDRTFEILDAQGNTFADTTIFIPVSQNTPFLVNLAITLYPGTDYFIKCRGNVDLYRNSQGATYPYNSTDVNITRSNAGTAGYYYFFFNWTYTEINCNSSRTICVGRDSCSSVGLNEFITDGALSLFPNPSNGEFMLKFNTKKMDTFKVEINNALGQIIYTQTFTDFSGQFENKIDISKFGKGTYTLSVSNSQNSTLKKLLVY